MTELMKRFRPTMQLPVSSGELIVVTTPALENETLEELTANIQKGHEQIESTISTAAVTAVENGIENGRRLLLLKKLAGHGNFEEYVARHFTFTMKTAQNYMRLAKQEGKLRQKLAEKRTGGSFLRMKEALEFIDLTQGKQKLKR
jgi:hypothetical protein